MKLPDQWMKTCIGSACELQAGKFMPASNIIESESANSYPCYGGGGLRGYVKKYSHDGTFPLIGRQGALCGQVKKAKGKFYATEHAVVAYPSSNVSADWLYYELVYLKLNQYATGLAQPGLSVKNVKKTQILLPPIAEQRKIADILTTWDEALEKLDALIAAKERRKQSLMQQLLTGKKRLKGFEEPVRFMRASEIFTNRSERNTESLPVLSVTQDQGVLLRSDLGRRISHNEDNTHTYKVVQAGDFIISLRSFQGGLEYSTITGAVRPAYHVIYPVIEIDRAFYQHYFKSVDFVSRLAVAVIGIRDGKQVSFTDFGFLRLPCPTLALQQKIATILDAAQAEINLLRTQRAALDQQKRGLMQRLLTGKVRVMP